MDIQPLDVLKWIGIVLAAGFIGYFGRYLAMMVIARIREKKAPADTAQTEPDTFQNDKTDAKIEKKRAKQAAKIAKKTGGK